MSATIAVSVAWATREAQEVVPLTLPAGATIGDAVAASGLLARHALDESTLRFGIFARIARADTALADGDRVEIYRPLATAPDAARRLRAEVKAARAAKR